MLIFDVCIFICFCIFNVVISDLKEGNCEEMDLLGDSFI